MSATTTLRNYLSIEELQSLANITVINNDEALRHIARAEEAIDDYVGYQCKSIEVDFRGQISSVSVDGLTIIDTNPSSQLHVTDGYFIGGVLEIIGGTGKGQRRYIAGSTLADYSVTLIDAFDTAPDTTSFFRIYQLAKFPRLEDRYHSPNQLIYYKTLPDQLRQAMVAQMEFMIDKGDAFFTGNDMDVQSETVGNYSYSRANAGQSSLVTLLGPRARNLLRSLKHAGGQLMADNPTSL